jgi:hypothetical protein
VAGTVLLQVGRQKFSEPSGEGASCETLVEGGGGYCNLTVGEDCQRPMLRFYGARHISAVRNGKGDLKLK